jgi:hypothetical protein
MMSTVIRRGLGLAALLLALPGASWAAETAVKALSSCCGGTCPLGCC